MSIGDAKLRGFSQGLYEISSTPKELIGTLRIDHFGRKFRYCYAGSTALNPGMLSVGADINANHVNTAMGSAVAVGTEVIDVPISAGTAIAENALRGGFLQINDGTGEGHSYPIESNAAASATATSVAVALAVGIKVALTATSEVSLITSQFYGTQESTTVYPPAGVPLIAVTANYYYWSQTGGMACVYTYETTGTGNNVEQSADSAGAVNTIDSDATEAMSIGFIVGTAGVSTEYKPIFLTLD
jgi:hypothetical protein